MPATRQDLIFEIGADGPFPKQFVWATDDNALVDLTGAIIKMEVRKNIDSAVILTLSTANGKITITDSTTINLNISAVDVTDELISSLTRFGKVTAGVIEGTLEDIIVSADGYLASYDLKITQTGGVVTRLLFGDVCFSREITQ
jgi:hypothetical protein